MLTFKNIKKTLSDRTQKNTNKKLNQKLSTKKRMNADNKCGAYCACVILTMCQQQKWASNRVTLTS